jgi:hypothetical protein
MQILTLITSASTWDSYPSILKAETACPSETSVLSAELHSVKPLKTTVSKISSVKSWEPALIILVFYSHGTHNSRSLGPTLRNTRNMPRVKGLLNNSDLLSNKIFDNVPNLETNIFSIDDSTVNETHALCGVQYKVSIMWRSSLAWLPTFLLVIVQPPPHQSIPAAEHPFLSVNARPIPPGTALGSLSQSKVDLFLLAFFTLPLHSRLSHATPSSTIHSTVHIHFGLKIKYWKTAHQMRYPPWLHM